MLKKTVLVVALFLVATKLWAAGPSDVSKTIHNLGSTSDYTEYRSGIEDEVCIFCHTPHGGTLDGPLWNRAITNGGGGGFTHYSSLTLSAYMLNPLRVNRAVNPESLLCLTCHDGTVAMGNIVNVGNRNGAATDVPTMLDEIFVGMGTSQVGGATKDLTDDHPISFSYSGSQGDPGNNGKLYPADNTPANDPRLKGITLFGAALNVECSSCHDPHVDYVTNTTYAPFLRTPNTASALCLACHIK